MFTRRVLNVGAIGTALLARLVVDFLNLGTLTGIGTAGMCRDEADRKTIHRAVENHDDSKAQSDRQG